MPAHSLSHGSLVWASRLWAAVLSAVLMPGVSAAAPPEGTTVSDHVQWMDTLPIGPFVRLDDGRILTVDVDAALISADHGQTWQRSALWTGDQQYEVRPERALIRTRQGTLILAFANNLERSWQWDKQTAEPGPDVRLPTYVTRSVDEGKSWEPPQKLHDDWTGAIRSMVQAGSGQIVFTTMKLLHNPGRHGCLTYTSRDEGRTWVASNLLDLGGHGHHDGALEPAILPLRDGRLWMLIRTNLDVLYESFSTDGGLTWGPMRPTTIDASAAPPMLHRMASGRIALVWNRFALEGQTDHPRRGGDNQWSARAASVQRNELSLAFSDDEAKTWTEPVVIVRSISADTSYPYIFEPQPGELWITTMRGSASLRLLEVDFVKQ